MVLENLSGLMQFNVCNQHVVQLLIVRFCSGKIFHIRGLLQCQQLSKQ